MVKPVYSAEFDFDGFAALSVVVTEEVFDRICDMLEGIINLLDGAKRSDAEAIDRIREFGMIPMVRRGTKTQQIFEFLGIDNYDYMSVVRRGFTRQMMEEE